jgi:hypothetical protein
VSGVFVSYRKDDAGAWASLLSDGLAAAYGSDHIFLDRDTLGPGRWSAQIEAALADCSVVLVVIGGDWLTVADSTGEPRLSKPDDVHRREIETALAGSATIIPVLVDGASMPRKPDLPASISRLADFQARTLSGDRRHRTADLQRLMADIESADPILTARRLQHLGSQVPILGLFRAALRLLLMTLVGSVALAVTLQVALGWTFRTEDVFVLVLMVFAALIAGSWVHARVRHRRGAGSASRSSGRTGSVALLTLLLPHGAEGAITVVCAAERAVVARTEPVQVRAWATDADGGRLKTKPTFTWRVLQGSISGTERATWRLTGAAPANPGVAAEASFEAKATVTVDAAPQGTGTCDVTVLVVASSQQPGETPVQRSARLAARLFLLPNMIEPADYGLRSYLIFTTPPRDDTARERDLKVIEAYLQVLVPAEDFLSQNVRASRLSVTMLPVVRSAGALETLTGAAGPRPLAVEILSNYDYANARRLLADVGVGEVGGGPYLVARETRSPAATQGKLLVDMSGVSSSLIWDWMTWFCWLTSQERSWSETAVRRLGLNIRNIIAVTAETTPVVLTSMSQSVYLLKSR